MSINSEREKWVKIQELYEAASSAIDRGDAGSALEFLERVIEIEPDEPEVLNLAGVAHFYRKEYDNALRFFERAVEEAPTFYKAWHNMGIIYEIRENLEIAVEYISQAVEIEPRFSKAWRSLGDCYFEMEEYELSKDAFLAAIQVDGNDVISMYNLARIYAMEQADDDAIHWLRNAISDPLIKESALREEVFARIKNDDSITELMTIEN